MKSKVFTLSGLTILLASLLPLGALAQGLTPYTVSTRAQPYVPLGAAATTYQASAFGSSNNDQWVVPLELDFNVRFFDENEDTLYISSNGWISFISTTNSNHVNAVIPATATPNALIAPFWDDLGCATMKSEVRGTAPARTVIVEWPCYRWNVTASTINMQVWLFEGSSTIEIHYGAVAGTAWTASMGIEDKTGLVGHWVPSSATGNDCGAGCTPADWHTNTVVTFSQGPELRMASIVGQPEGFAGVPMPVKATVANAGGKTASDFTVRFWVSPTPTLTESSVELLTLEGDVRTLLPQASTVYEASPRLPANLEEGSYYLLAEADPFLRVPESNRGDNVAAYGPFTIGIRAANLSMGQVNLSHDWIPFDGEVDVEFLVDNRGNLDAVGIPYQISLTDSGAVGPSVPILATGTIGRIDSLQSVLWRHEGVRLPEGLRAGQYRLAVTVDPNREIFEHDRSDNVGLSWPLIVAGEELFIATEQLPVAHAQGHYSVRLEAFGGDGVHYWAMKRGSSLPPGLSLVREEGRDGTPATFLRGVPSSAGTFEFALTLASANLVAEKDYTLEVGKAGGHLTIASENLASAAFGFRYEEWLAAFGGVPPYTWDLARGDLPMGVLLRSDGFLSGTPQQDGRFPITVRVSDSQGMSRNRDLSLEVSAPSSLTCVTRELPELPLGQRVREVLVAAGGEKVGTDSYTWSTIDTLRLRTRIGEEGAQFGTPPPGLEIRGGLVQGTPSEIGTYVWRLRLEDAGRRSTKECHILVRVPEDRGLAVVTQGLPKAFAGRRYQARLEAAGGDGNLVWSEYEDGRVLQDLGLSFDPTGLLVGTPSLTLLDGEAFKEVSLMVQVRDEANRVGVGSLTLRLEARPPVAEKEVEEGGCQTASGAAGGLWSLSILALFFGLRRFRRASDS